MASIAHYTLKQPQDLDRSRPYVVCDGWVYYISKERGFCAVCIRTGQKLATTLDHHDYSSQFPHKTRFGLVDGKVVYCGARVLRYRPTIGEMGQVFGTAWYRFTRGMDLTATVYHTVEDYASTSLHQATPPQPQDVLTMPDGYILSTSVDSEHIVQFGTEEVARYPRKETLISRELDRVWFWTGDQLTCYGAVPTTPQIDDATADTSLKIQDQTIKYHSRIISFPIAETMSPMAAARYVLDSFYAGHYLPLSDWDLIAEVLTFLHSVGIRTAAFPLTTVPDQDRHRWTALSVGVAHGYPTKDLRAIALKITDFSLAPPSLLKIYAEVLWAGIDRTKTPAPEKMEQYCQLLKQLALLV